MFYISITVDIILDWRFSLIYHIYFGRNYINRKYFFMLRKKHRNRKSYVAMHCHYNPFSK